MNKNQEEHPHDRYLRIEKVADTITAGLLISALWGLVIAIGINLI